MSQKCLLSIGPRGYSVVLTDVMKSWTRCFIASLSRTGKMVWDRVGVLLLKLYMRAYEWGLCSLNLDMKKKKHLKQSSVHGATCPLECHDGVTCHLEQWGTNIFTSGDNFVILNKHKNQRFLELRNLNFSLTSAPPPLYNLPQQPRLLSFICTCFVIYKLISIFQSLTT